MKLQFCQKTSVISHFQQAHFSADQFYVTPKGRRRLLKTAVPTIFSHRPVPKVRKPPKVRLSVTSTIDPKDILCHVQVDHSYGTRHERYFRQKLMCWDSNVALMPP